MKTGSSFIQKTFSDNQSIFREFGIWYPHSPESKFSPHHLSNFSFVQSEEDISEAKELLIDENHPKILFSDEGLFSSLNRIKNPVFADYKKVIILYLRRPAEIVASWAGENAQPYNAFVKEMSLFGKPVAIEDSILECCSIYAGAARSFLDISGSIENTEVIVRPFDRDLMVGKDLLTDFLSCLDISISDVRKADGFVESDLINEGISRKLCDISVITWHALGQPNTAKIYNIDFVERVSRGCSQGDERKVVDTLSRDMIIEIEDRLKFLEVELSQRYFDASRIFRVPFGEHYEGSRRAYETINISEVRQQVQMQLIIDTRNKIARIERNMLFRPSARRWRRKVQHLLRALRSGGRG